MSARSLSHNTVRGAAGGLVLLAELADALVLTVGIPSNPEGVDPWWWHGRNGDDSRRDHWPAAH